MPAGVPTGIWAGTVPLAEVVATAPMLTGEANEPLASESCTVKVLPLFTVPVVTEYGTLRGEPGQKLPLTVPVASTMVGWPTTTCTCRFTEQPFKLTVSW